MEQPESGARDKQKQGVKRSRSRKGRDALSLASGLERRAKKHRAQERKKAQEAKDQVLIDSGKVIEASFAMTPQVFLLPFAC